MNILKASPWKAALLLAALTLHACSPHTVQPTPTGAVCRTEAHFSRRGGAADSVIEVLNRAQSTVHVAMYGLTHPAIVDALVAAKNHGVHVALKLDKLESAGKTQAAMITKLQAAGVPVEVSEQSRLLHHKFAVIDGRYVVTGSYNWTESAERRNRENMVVLECTEIAQAFSARVGVDSARQTVGGSMADTTSTLTAVDHYPRSKKLVVLIARRWGTP